MISLMERENRIQSWWKDTGHRRSDVRKPYPRGEGDRNFGSNFIDPSVAKTANRKLLLAISLRSRSLTFFRSQSGFHRTQQGLLGKWFGQNQHRAHLLRRQEIRARGGCS